MKKEVFDLIREMIEEGKYELASSWFKEHAHKVRRSADKRLEREVNKEYNGRSYLKTIEIDKEDADGYYCYYQKNDVRDTLSVLSLFHNDKDTFVFVSNDYVLENLDWPTLNNLESYIESEVPDNYKKYTYSITSIPVDWIIETTLFAVKNSQQTIGLHDFKIIKERFDLDYFTTFGLATYEFIHDEEVIYDLIALQCLKKDYFKGREILIHHYKKFGKEDDGNGKNQYLISLFLLEIFDKNYSDAKNTYFDLRKINGLINYEELEEFLVQNDYEKPIATFFEKTGTPFNIDNKLITNFKNRQYDKIFFKEDYTFNSGHLYKIAAYFFKINDFEQSANCLFELVVKTGCLVSNSYYAHPLELVLVICYYLYSFTQNNAKQNEVLSTLELIFTNSDREKDLARIYDALGEDEKFERICKEYNLENLLAEHYQEQGNPGKAEEIILGDTVDDLFSEDTETNKTNQCGKCNNINPENAKYCFECGNALESRCDKCNEVVNDIKFKYCPNCGNKL